MAIRPKPGVRRPESLVHRNSWCADTGCFACLASRNCRLRVAMCHCANQLNSTPLPFYVPTCQAVSIRPNSISGNENLLTVARCGPGTVPKTTRRSCFLCCPPNVWQPRLGKALSGEGEIREDSGDTVPISVFALISPPGTFPWALGSKRPFLLPPATTHQSIPPVSSGRKRCVGKTRSAVWTGTMPERY